MKIIKVSGLCEEMFYQAPIREGIYGDCQFVINDNHLQECDGWFIFDPNCLEKDNRCICPKENVYFVMGEPDCIHIYNDRFVRQFANIISAQKTQYNHSDCIHNYWGTWFVGLSFLNGQPKINPAYYYDKLVNMDVPSKSKLLSVVSSNKRFCDGHVKRLEFVEKLKAHFGDKIDIFGRGINDFVDKADVLMPYKYHVAIENASQDDYITEKLFDPYITYTYPIYYGANNVHEYFSEKSLSCININDPERAIRIIENVIAEDAYEKNIEYIKKERNKIINKYNLFSRMMTTIKSKGDVSSKQMIILKPEYEFNYKYQVRRFVKKLLKINR